MELRRLRPARLAAAAFVGLFVAVTLASCSSGPLESGPLSPGPVATVDGVDISRDELDRYLAATTAFYEQAVDLGFVEQAEADDYLENTAGAGEDTVARPRVSGALAQLIQAELVRAELERSDALPTDDEIDAVRAELDKQGAEKIAKIDPAFLDFSIESRANTQALAKLRAAEADKDVVQPDPAEVQKQRDELYPQVVEAQPYCVNVIQAASKEEADAALARVEAGEDFQAVAEDVSQGQVTDPFGGCGSAEDIQGFVASEGTTFAVGDRFGPTLATSSDGTETFGVVEIISTEGPTREQAEPQLAQQVPSEIPPTDPASLDLSSLIAELFDGADITVDPQYGSWNAETRAIDPPYPGTTTTLPVQAIPGS